MRTKVEGDKTEAKLIVKRGRRGERERVRDRERERKISTLGLNLGGGVRSFLCSLDRFLTIFEWMAQLTQ